MTFPGDEMFHISNQCQRGSNFHGIRINGGDACHCVFLLNFSHKYDSYFLKYFVSKYLLNNHLSF